MTPEKGNREERENVKSSPALEGLKFNLFCETTWIMTPWERVQRSSFCDDLFFKMKQEFKKEKSKKKKKPQNIQGWDPHSMGVNTMSLYVNEL